MLRRDIDEEINYSSTQYRHLPQKESNNLDAPNIKDDYYVNIMDWGKNHILGIALGSVFYLWNATNGKIHKLSEEEDDNDDPTSVAWSQDANMIAVGHMRSNLHIWDAQTSKIIRCLDGHNKKRVGCVAWNGNILTLGGYDKTIINHDDEVRAPLHV